MTKYHFNKLSFLFLSSNHYLNLMTLTHTHFLGKYQNISLSESELEQLKTELPSLYQKYIDKLSEYMASTGKTYNSHIATIRKWAKEDSEKNAKTNKAPRNYNYDGNKSL